MENERKIKARQHTAGVGFCYSGQVLTDLFKDIDRGELVDRDGSIWSAKNPNEIPEVAASDQEYAVSLELPGGAKKMVNLNIAAVMIRNNATAGDLLQKFQAEGLSRGEAFRRIGREYPRAHEEFLEFEWRRQERERRARQ